MMIRIVVIFLVLLLVSCAGNKPVPNGNTRDNETKASQTKVQKTSRYKVKKGDTLYSISFRAGMDYKTLAKINNIKTPYTIYVGQELTLLQGGAPIKTTANAKTTSKKATTNSSNTSNKNLAWHWPTEGKVISTYSKTATGRKGIDIAGKSGQAVVATAAGKVVYSGDGLPRYGNLLIVKHNDVYLSAYAHNKTLLVKEGQQVKAGQKIALLGRTGTQKDQLHFEIRRNGKPVDPLRFLPKR